MEASELFISKGQRFFKLSELAGKRWPNVTDDDIFNWHDIGLVVPVDHGGGLVETPVGPGWCNSPHNGKVNIMSLWVFFPEFRSLLSDQEIYAATGIKKRLYEAHPCDLLTNSFFMVEPDSAKGFAFNRDGKVNCPVVFDEKGKPLCPAELHPGTEHYGIGQVEIKKEDLLVKASSVRLIEQLVPEINSTSFRDNSPVRDTRSGIRGDQCSERTDLKVIGVLASLIRENKIFPSQEKIIATIEKRYKKIPGLSKRTLEGRLAKGNKALGTAIMDFKESISD